MSKVHVIAEMGLSHCCDLQKACDLALAAKNSGADSVKTQIIFAHELLHPAVENIPSGEKTLFDFFADFQCGFDFFFQLKNYCDEIGIAFSASVFGFQSWDFLQRLQPCYCKVASPELNHIPLLQEIGKREDIPVILSVGLSKLSDIERALECLSEKQKKVLLHCVVAYPATEENYNLRLIKTLGKVFALPVGLSDHSLHPYLLPSLAVAMGAVVIEKHFCLSKLHDGPDDAMALNPDEFRLMTDKIRWAESTSPHEVVAVLGKEFGNERVEKILGSGKKIHSPDEARSYGRTNRSIHFMKDKKAGEKILIDDIAVLRTGGKLSVGISPEFFREVHGAVLKRDAKSGDGLTFFHLF